MRGLAQVRLASAPSGDRPESQEYRDEVRPAGASSGPAAHWL